MGILQSGDIGDFTTSTLQETSNFFPRCCLGFDSYIWGKGGKQTVLSLFDQLGHVEFLLLCEHNYKGFASRAVSLSLPFKKNSDFLPQLGGSSPISRFEIHLD